MKGSSLFGSAVEDAHADPVLPEIDCGHQWQYDVVQGHRDGRGYFVAFEYPRHRDREQRFHAPERGEAKKNSDG